jgi:hypothetical protein
MTSLVISLVSSTSEVQLQTLLLSKERQMNMQDSVPRLTLRVQEY